MRLGVAGWPVAHSRSPDFQNAALQAAGLAGWRYQLLPIPPPLFSDTVAALPERGFRGVNVTIPHKHQALAFAHAGGGTVSARAQAIGAANTLVFEPSGEVTADNSDAPGLIAAVTAPRAALGRPVAGATALVLGAGGSARAVVWALLDAGAAEVRVWNRTYVRARELCASLGGGTPVAGAQAAGAQAAGAQAADLLVNCTSVGLHAEDSDAHELSALPLGAGELPYRMVVDLVYRDGGTALLRRARAEGLATVDGLELLVAQGAISFEQFTGVPAQQGPMRAALGLAP